MKVCHAARLAKSEVDPGGADSIDPSWDVQDVDLHFENRAQTSFVIEVLPAADDGTFVGLAFERDWRTEADGWWKSVLAIAALLPAALGAVLSFRDEIRKLLQRLTSWSGEATESAK